MKFPFNLRWNWAPEGAPAQQRENFKFAQLDALGTGIANGAAPFLPVFLTRLGATNFQVGLLTAMPALTGLALALLVGRRLHGRNVVAWFGRTRLIMLSGFTLTGLIAFVVPPEQMVLAVLVLWAVITVPQTILTLSFSIVMNEVAGPARRYDLMSRRWSIIGLVTAVLVAIVGQVLELIRFPLNYQLVFIVLSLGGLISYHYINRIQLSRVVAPITPQRRAPAERLKGYVSLLRGQGDFVRLSFQQFVFTFGNLFALPLFPLYYIRDVQVTDAWFGVITTLQTLLTLVGYWLWPRSGRRRGSRFVLLWTTLALSLHPALAALTGRVELIVLLAGLSGIFQAGLDLVFFDELFKTVPPEHGPTFISLAQTLQFAATLAGPVAGTLLADQIGLGAALLVGAGLRLGGFALFALWTGPKRPAAQVATEETTA